MYTPSPMFMSLGQSNLGKKKQNAYKMHNTMTLSASEGGKYRAEVKGTTNTVSTPRRT